MFTYISGFANQFFIILGQMSPYLLLGFLFAGILHEFIPSKQIERFFGGNKFTSSINAALFGIPLPLCSCGVIPTGVSFFKSGASKGSTVSFLISTPQTGVDSILVTYSLLGLPFAILRPIVAFITGVFGGYFTNLLDYFPPKKEEVNCKSEVQQKSIKHKFVGVFKYGFVEFLQDISKWLVLGLVLAAILSLLIPDNFFAGLGFSPIVQMLIILVASIPLYICATASVPLAAILLLKGVSPGAALVLLMAGPATNAATITMIAKVMGNKTLFAYLFSITVGALLFGIIIDYFLPSQWFSMISSNYVVHNHHEQSSWIQIFSGVLLLILIINGYLQKKHMKLFKRKNNKIQVGDNVFLVEGISCNHCKNNVESNLLKLDFVTNVEVDLPTGKVSVEGDNIDAEIVRKTIVDLGYKCQE